MQSWWKERVIESEVVMHPFPTFMRQAQCYRMSSFTFLMSPRYLYGYCSGFMLIFIP